MPTATLTDASPARAQAAPAPISLRLQRYLTAGAGASLPLLVGIWADRDTFLRQSMDPATLVAFLLTTAACFAAGVAAAWLYADEHNRLKLFQLGVAAPAMFTAMTSGASRDSSRESLAVTPPAAEVSARSALTLASAAPAAPSQRRVFSFTDQPQPGLGESLLRGVTRSAPRYGLTFVYVREAFPTASAAFARADEIERAGVSTRVYGRGGPVDGFVVVLGDWLTHADAGQVLAEVQAKGLGAHLWTRPGS